MTNASQLILAMSLFLLLSFGVQSQTSNTNIFTPEVNSDLYSQLLNAARPSVEFELRTKIKFTVLAMNVKDEWAFLALQALHPDGSSIDFKTTRFETPTEEMTNTRTLVLLKNTGPRWHVIRQQTGQIYGLWTDEASYFVEDFNLFRSKIFDNNNIETIQPAALELKKSLLDAIRPRIEAEVKSPVIFQVHSFSVSGSKAKICAVPQNPDGSKIDLSKTILRETFDDNDVDGPETGIEGTFSHLRFINGFWHEVSWEGGQNICKNNGEL